MCLTIKSPPQCALSTLLTHAPNNSLVRDGRKLDVMSWIFSDIVTRKGGLFANITSTKSLTFLHFCINKGDTSTILGPLDLDLDLVLVALSRAASSPLMHSAFPASFEVMLVSSIYPLFNDLLNVLSAGHPLLLDNLLASFEALASPAVKFDSLSATV